MNILIISHYYKHKNAMASIRPIKLAKYFDAAGHNVTVLTSLQKDNWCKQELIPAPSDTIKEIYAPEHKGMKYLLKVYDVLKKRGERKTQNQVQAAYKADNQDVYGKTKPSFKVRVKQKLSWFFYYSCDRLENYFLGQGLINAAKDNRLSGFDIVIATYPGAGVHTAGEWVKKKRLAQFFIADYRDPAYNPGGRSNKTELRHDKHVQDQAIKYADAVVCVSQGMADSLIGQYNVTELPPVYMVTNGFDPDDNKASIPANLNPDKYNYVYTGALYQGRRTVEMLARVLRVLIDEGIISEDRLAINYAGPDFMELLNQLKPYNLETIAVDFGYVSRQQSLGLQQESDMVLLLNWNDDNYTGVIPGKLYEYMAAKRPICALIMGNQAGSESARMIEENKLGCACEQASKSDIKKLEEYMRVQFAQFNSGNHSRVETDSISKFEYRNIARQYLDVIEDLIKD